MEGQFHSDKGRRRGQLHPDVFAALEYFCPEGIAFTYNPSNKDLYIFASEEDKEEYYVNVGEAKTTTLKHNYVGENFCQENSTQRILKMVGIILCFSVVARINIA